MLARFKLWLYDNRRDVVTFVLFLFVSLISFSLGYLVANQAEHAPIIIEQRTAAVP